MQRKRNSLIVRSTKLLQKLDHGLGRKSQRSMARQVVNDKVMLSSALIYISWKVK